MKKYLSKIVLATALLLQLFNLEPVTGCERTQNLLMPDFIIGVTPSCITPCTAISAFGEIGRRNYRGNATFGFLLGESHAFKVSGEYLSQRLRYHFRTGNEAKWVDQWAVGGAYRYDLCCNYLSDIEFSGYYAHSCGRNLKSEFFDGGRFEVFRHVAGARAFGFTLGTTLLPWSGASLTVDGDYDDVCYHRHFRHRKHITGFGGSFDFYQQMFCNFVLNLKGEFRRPFNYLKAALNWSDPCFFEGLTVGLFGTHTRGKSHLPSCTTAGIELNYVFGGTPWLRSCSNTCDVPCCNPRLMQWVSTTAVYMPEVLAIADQISIEIIPVCPPPTSTAIGNVVVTAGTYTVDTAPNFTSPGGEPFTFSATGLPSGSTINPTTGVITGPNLGTGTFPITVIGATICGSTSQTFTVTFTSA